MGRIDISPISGFPEWLPSERRAEQLLIDRIRAQYELFGFAPVDTPAVERLAVLMAKGGIQRQIFTLGRPDTDEGEAVDLGLHFDLTVPLARYVALHANELTFPFRRYQIQKVWRGERAQRGRFREFYQCDMDIIGNSTLDLLHDAEIVRVIHAAFSAIEVGEFRVHISNRRVLTDALVAVGVRSDEVDEALRLVDKHGTKGSRRVATALAEAFGPDVGTPIADLLDADGLHEATVVLERVGAATRGLEELYTVRDAAIQLGTPDETVKIDLSIARGLDYYTGTVYETFIVGREEWGSVCSGGRYDDLAGYFTSRKLPGVGVSIGLSRLFSLLSASGVVPKLPSSPTQVLITVQDRDAYLAEYLELANAFRDAGTPAEVYLQPRKLKDQLRYAAAIGAPFAVIAGSEEFAKGVIGIRDMEQGEQVEIPRGEAVDHVQARLSPPGAR